MAAIRDLMTGDHRRCDDLFVVAEKLALDAGGPAAADAWESFGRMLFAHFEAEETILFPAFEDRTGIRSGPTATMRLEHEQMRELCWAAAQALADGDAETCADCAETLLIMMQQHNLKEENILYPMCDQMLAAAAGDLTARIGRALAGPPSP